MRLTDGSRICIVGAGPAGCFAAMHALKLAQEQQIKVSVTVFEARPANDHSYWPPCKGCAGVLSPAVLEGFARLDLSFPDTLVHEEIFSYVVHLPNDYFTIERPQAERRIISVYRGNGPRSVLTEDTSSFDEFLRRTIVARGANLVRESVLRFELGERPIIVTQDGEHAADLLILAMGVNGKNTKELCHRYQRPKTVRMSLGEIDRPENWQPGTVAAFFDKPHEIIFGAMVPKKSFVNIALLGRKGTRRTIDEFLATGVHRLKGFFNRPTTLACQCRPMIPVSLSKKFYGDRWVAVGDAAISRLYKDGIGSAYRTAQAAVEVAFKQGIRSSDFGKDYASFCRSIARDNVLGSLVFRVAAFMLRHKHFSKVLLACIEEERSEPPSNRRFYRLIWGLLTGDGSYTEITKLLLSHDACRKFLKHMIKKTNHKKQC